MKAVFPLYILVSVIALATCKKDKLSEESRYFAEVAVTAVDGTGVSFSAKLRSLSWDEIDQVGFVWSTETVPFTAETAFEVNTERPSLDGNIQLKTETGVEEGTTYYVAAFVIVDGQYHYSKPIQFVGQGSRGPVVRSLTPHSGSWGDTITVHVQNIPSLSSEIAVAMDGIPATIVYSDKESVKFVVPEALNEEQPIIELVIDGSISKQNWYIVSPKLDSVSNYYPAMGERVILYGKNFNPDASRNKVAVGELAYEVVSASRDRLEFIVGHHPMSIKDYLTVSTVGEPVTSEFYIAAGKHIRRLNDFPGSARYWGFANSLNGIGYFGLGALGRIDAEQLPPPDDLWSYDAATDSWQLLNHTFPNSNSYLLLSFVHDGKIYVGGGMNDEYGIGRHWYAYTPADNQWAQSFVASEASIERIVSGFSTGDEAIVTTISDNRVAEYYEMYRTHWEYRGTLDKAHFEGVSFVINGKYYSTTGFDYNEGYNNDLDVYDFATKKWSKAAPFPGAGRRQSTGFVLNDKGYVYGGNDYSGLTNDIWEYTPQTNTWELVDHVISSAHSGFSSFVIGQKAYIIGGAVDDVSWSKRASKEVWEFSMD